MDSVIYNASSITAFFLNFGATASGVALSIFVWVLIQRRRQQKRQKQTFGWLKSSLMMEIEHNIDSLKEMQEDIKKIKSGGNILGTLSHYYMDLNMYKAASGTSDFILIAPQLREKIHRTYSSMQRYNILLAHTENFVASNCLDSDFRKHLKTHLEVILNQAPIYQSDAEDTLIAIKQAKIDLSTQVW